MLLKWDNNFSPISFIISILEPFHLYNYNLFKFLSEALIDYTQSHPPPAYRISIETHVVPENTVACLGLINWTSLILSISAFHHKFYTTHHSWAQYWVGYTSAAGIRSCLHWPRLITRNLSTSEIFRGYNEEARLSDLFLFDANNSRVDWKPRMEFWTGQMKGHFEAQLEHYYPYEPVFCWITEPSIQLDCSVYLNIITIKTFFNYVIVIDLIMLTKKKHYCNHWKIHTPACFFMRLLKLFIKYIANIEWRD